MRTGIPHSTAHSGGCYTNMTSDHPWRDEDRLREMHHEKEMYIAQMARELGCSPQTVSKWLRRHSIEVVSNSATPAGDDHHASKPDVTPRDYNGQWGTVRKQYREEHEMVCRRCGDDSLRDGNYHLHHVNESEGRETNAGDVDFENLVPLCPPCHQTVEINGFDVA